VTAVHNPRRVCSADPASCRLDSLSVRDITEHAMSITIGHLAPVVALICGILILIMPRLLNYIVAIYLIVTGIIGLGIFK
jgi:hypothetical protein